MDIGEKIVALMQRDMSDREIECPFTGNPTNDVSRVEDEDIARDDRDAAWKQQANNGGVLGDNLRDGSQGAEGTVGGPYPPKENPEKQPANDTSRAGKWVFVPGARAIEDGVYPFLVAAHHLIPGDESLAKSELKHYMTKGGNIKGSSKTWTIKSHVGYNVNGAHNGGWCPGNYAIRPDGKEFHAVPVEGKKWSELGKHPWCLNYVAATTKATGRQFHDRHAQYSEAVKKLLNKIYFALLLHQENCPLCSEQSEVPPPYIIKLRLYNLSRYLRMKTGGSPQAWRRPWFASDRWRDEAFTGGTVSPEFLDAYAKAGSTTTQPAEA